MEHSLARPRPRFSKRASHHGPDSVHVVPPDRPESAKICAEHLQGGCVRLHCSDAADLLLSGDAFVCGIAGHALDRVRRALRHAEDKAKNRGQGMRSNVHRPCKNRLMRVTESGAPWLICRVLASSRSVQAAAARWNRTGREVVCNKRYVRGNKVYRGPIEGKHADRAPRELSSKRGRRGG